MRTHVERTLIDHDFETEFQQTFGPAMEAERSGFRSIFLIQLALASTIA